MGIVRGGTCCFPCQPHWSLLFDWRVLASSSRSWTAPFPWTIFMPCCSHFTKLIRSGLVMDPGGMRHAKGIAGVTEVQCETPSRFQTLKCYISSEKIKNLFYSKFCFRASHQDLLPCVSFRNSCRGWWWQMMWELSSPSKPEHFLHSGFHGCYHPVPYVWGKTHEVHNLI